MIYKICKKSFLALMVASVAFIDVQASLPTSSRQILAQMSECYNVDCYYRLDGADPTRARFKIFWDVRSGWRPGTFSAATRTLEIRSGSILFSTGIRQDQLNRLHKREINEVHWKGTAMGRMAGMQTASPMEMDIYVGLSHIERLGRTLDKNGNSTHPIQILNPEEFTAARRQITVSPRTWYMIELKKGAFFNHIYDGKISITHAVIGKSEDGKLVVTGAIVAGNIITLVGDWYGGTLFFDQAKSLSEVVDDSRYMEETGTAGLCAVNGSELGTEIAKSRADHAMWRVIGSKYEIQ